MLRKALDVVGVVRAMGPAWATNRIGGIVSSRLGRMQTHIPSQSWEHFDVQVDADALRQREVFPIDESAAIKFQHTLDDSSWEDEISKLAAGQMRFFSGDHRAIGWPPEWHRSVDFNKQLPADSHFSQISTFSYGDIKSAWEPARFSFVWLLIHAHFAGDGVRPKEMYFQALQDFVRHNQPFNGPQWMCGQEAALRALIVLAGWSVFGKDASPDDISNLVRLLSATGLRIERHIEYALSQKNNHGMSEAMGLLVIGLALPEHPRSTVWRERGSQLLEQLADELVDKDGGFSQQSANYHRVMLHVLSASVAIARKASIELPSCVAALQRAVRFLSTLIQQNGKQPRYGQDDGACVLDFSTCQYDDFRPAIQEAAFACGMNLPLPAGPWDAGLFWLGASEVDSLARTPLTPPRKATFEDAGIAVLRNERHFVSMRLAAPRIRPGQLDSLHVDVWLDGFNIAIDPGTYRYTSEGVWASTPLACGISHNGITSPPHDLARRVSRFLNYPWPKTAISPDANDNRLRATFCRKMGPVERWVRTVQLDANEVIVKDQLTCKLNTDVRGCWQLPDLPVISEADDRLDVQTPVGIVTLQVSVSEGVRSTGLEVCRATDGAVGWYAPRYAELQPCLSVLLRFNSEAVTNPVITSRFTIKTQSPDSTNAEPIR